MSRIGRAGRWFLVGVIQLLAAQVALAQQPGYAGSGACVDAVRFLTFTISYPPDLISVGRRAM